MRLVGWLLIVLASAGVGAGELTGRVLRVERDERSVRVELSTPGTARVGDRVTISFEVPGLGPVDLEGEWKVAEVEGGVVVAAPVGRTGQPQVGQTATIYATSGAEPGRVADVSGTGRDPRVQPSGFPEGRPLPPLRSAESLFEEAMAALDGTNGRVPDLPKAIRLLEEAARLGHPPSQVRLGVMHGFGQGLPKDSRRAAELYRAAAKSGSAEGEYNLGVLHAGGKGVPQDASEAARLFKLSAEKGHAMAQHNLAVLYQSGTGIQQDLVASFAWMSRAADQGQPESQYALGKLYEHGSGVDADQAQATEWYRKSARQGHVPAQQRLRELGLGW